MPLPTLEQARIAIASEGSFPWMAGWIRSYMSRRPEDAEGNPTAWYSYSALRFIGGRLRKDMEVFEFGAGYSTLWYASMVRSVASVDDNPGWVDHIKDLPPNAKVRLERDMVKYALAARDAGMMFDVICIDGAVRVECAKMAPKSLKAGGVIVHDNTNNGGYREGYDFLKGCGFKQIEFYGLTPICTYAVGTSVFYRPGNCFGI